MRPAAYLQTNRPRIGFAAVALAGCVGLAFTSAHADMIPDPLHGFCNDRSRQLRRQQHQYAARPLYPVRFPPVAGNGYGHERDPFPRHFAIKQRCLARIIHDGGQLVA